MKLKSKFAAFAVAGAIIVTALGGAQAAQAAPISPNGGITITPTTGNSTTVAWLTSLSTARNCTTSSLSGTFAYQGGNNVGNLSLGRVPAESNTGFGNFGFGPTAIALDNVGGPNPYLTNDTLNSAATIMPGNWEIRVYCFVSDVAPDFVNDPYFVLPMTMNAAGTWAVFTAPPAAVATTVSLTASSTGNTVNLSATVRNPALATATAAVGNMLFFEGATQVASVPVALGVAIAPALTRVNGTYVYTAQFVSTDAVFAGSVSASGTVNVGGQSATSTITVAIPNNVGALTLTGVSTSVSLGTAALNVATSTLDASGTLVATVTDTRQLNFPAWSLTGQVGDFTKTSPAATLDGKFLGWTPSVTGSTALNSTAGAVVAPATVALGNGLKTSSAFANGAPSATGTVTSASAVLLLKAPTNTPAGAYTATLTVTLI